MSSASLLLILCLGTVLAIPSLRELAEKKGLFIGAAANSYHIMQASSQYNTTLGQQYSIITPENSMKWGATEPQRGQFDFSQGDIVATSARVHKQKIRGHNLCWGVYNPSWLENGNFSPDEKKSILETHIKAVVGHYNNVAGDLMYSWDVVNEAVSDQTGSGNATLKHNVWYPAVPNYIDLAFQYARQAAPNLKLFYNDYSAEGMNAKSDAVYNLVKSMKQRGIPIDGVGLQMHVGENYYPKPSDVQANIKRLADLGLEVHITEMDVKLNGQGSEQQKLQDQANIYVDMLKACLTSDKCKSFETWGVTDKYTWLGSNLKPLEFDENYQPKPCFTALANALS